MIDELRLFACLCRGHWVLIILMVKECKAFYLDSLKNKAKRDYTVLSRILDDALFEHAYKGGNVPKKVKVLYALSIIQMLVAHSSRIVCHVATTSATTWTYL
jgi:hypothetical protein